MIKKCKVEADGVCRVRGCACDLGSDLDFFDDVIEEEVIEIIEVDCEGDEYYGYPY